jgi:hypothetical protein
MVLMMELGLYHRHERSVTRDGNTPKLRGVLSTFMFFFYLSRPDLGSINGPMTIYGRTAVSLHLYRRLGWSFDPEGACAI